MANLKEIGEKRQKKWKETNIYQVKEDKNKKKFYVLDMFPYPSGSGLHVGHPKGYIASDVLARKKMLEGFSVLHPMGFDTFWLGTENYAIEHKMKPQVVAKKNIETYIKQLEMFWCTYDRDRSVSTADEDYYKWTQRIFLKMYTHYYDEKEAKAKPISELEKQLKQQNKSDSEIKEIIDNQRLAYVDYKPINRCPKCMTGLANEDLDDGKCERCGSEVEQKPMRQRVLRITKYAERLITGLDGLSRDESMKDLERNWIGKSEGTQFKMNIKDSNSLLFEVYTTRVDTVFGMSFVVMAPEHPLVDQITTAECKANVEKYKEQAKYKTQLERTELQKEKTGEFTGAYAINPFNREKIPVYVGDYVLANYGTGVVMAVPAHDERDFEFAKKYDIKITAVIEPIKIYTRTSNETFSEENTNEWIKENNEKNEAYKKDLFEWKVCYTEKGILVNSWEFSGLTSDEAIAAMQQRLSEKGLGGKKSNYKIQDRVFSRQRYRGEPFPVVFCDDCGIVPIDPKDLPLTLPDVENYAPTGTEEWPLAAIDSWIKTTCPHCGKPAKRESNTMPGRAGSSRYRLRYMDNKNDQQLVSPENEKYRGNVDVYVGGAEHVTRHMIYARFWQKFLYDIWVVTHDEPFQKYHKVGLIMAEDGRKMSKRRWNVVNPDDIINEFGSDTLRTYEMFMGPFEQAIARSTNGIKGVKKFLDKIEALQSKITDSEDKKTLNLLHQTIKKLTEDIDWFKHNTAIAQLMIFVNHLTNQTSISKDTFEKLVILIAPFAPHLAEELWEQLWNKYSVFTTAVWPSYDAKYLVADTITLAVQINGKMRGTLEMSKDADQETVMNTIQNDSKFSAHLSWTPKKIIYVQGKIINIII